jgi:LemA protein
MSPMTVLYVGLGALAALVVALVLAYNGLVRVRNKVREAWSGIDVQLERRQDLIPNLVATVQEYAAHERELFEQVASARSLAQAARGPVAAGLAETVLGQAVGKLVAVSEAYPQLRASRNFLELQRELTNTEDEIAAARRIYNGNVQIYNTRLESFPANLWAPAFGFAAADLFEAEPVSRVAPQASLGAPLNPA